MNQYSPTSLTILSKNCPKALDFYLRAKHEVEDFEVEGPEMAEIGIAFHACVHHAALAQSKGESKHAAIDATATALVSRMAPARVIEGKELALAFIDWWTFPENFQFEQGMAFDGQWNVVPWGDEKRRIRMIFDSTGIETIEHDYYGELNVGVVQDYKTGWGAGKHELDSTQMDVCLTAAAKRFEGRVDAIKVEIIGVRHRQVYSRLYVLGDEQDKQALLDRKDRCEWLMAAADVSDGKARYGPGCMSCSYTGRCDAFQKRATELKESGFDPNAEPAQMARDLAVLTAKSKEVEEHLKVVARQHPVVCDGMVIGFHPTEKRVVKDPNAVLDVWLEASKGSVPEPYRVIMRGLIAKIAPGVTALEDVIGACAKNLGFKTKKAATEALVPKYVAQEPTLKWGWQKAAKKEGAA